MSLAGLGFLKQLRRMQALLPTQDGAKLLYIPRQQSCAHTLGRQTYSCMGGS